MDLDSILTTVYYVIWSLSATFREIQIPTDNVTLTYTLFTPGNPEPKIITNLDELEINTEHEIKILCHGFNYPNYTTEWYNYTIEEYMQKENVSVITVYYGDIAKNTLSYQTSKYSTYLGEHVGNFTLKLNEIKGIQFEKVHIIGHLLGAHIAGIAGEKVYEETGKYIDRITGIDPVNQGYMKLPIYRALNRYSAKFVDVIYINNYAYQQQLGRIEFYGYWYMVKCSNYKNYRIMRHLGPIYYANSINNKEVITATKCSNKFGNFFSKYNCKENVTAILGEHVDREEFGRFYLKEEDISKYACARDANLHTGIETSTETNEV